MKTMKKLSLVLLLAAAVSSAFAQQPPAAARGFDPNKVFAAGPIDSINAFNGNVIATIPLGETYRVSPTLAYSFNAIHNGKTWDYVRRRITIPVPCDPPSQSECTTVWTDMQAVPDGTANAGFGWRVQFARFILPGDLQANSDRLLLETLDGAQHGMYVSLHDGDPEDGASYTRDATYLRRQETGVAGRTAVDTPEGVTYEFTNYKLTQMHDQVKDASGNYVNRVDIQYGLAAGDPPWPCADPAISQKITDTRNRTSYVCFENMNYDGTNRPTVTDVYVGTPAGTGHYEFNHVQTAFARENYDKGYQYLYLPATATVPALMSITLAEDSSYAFQYFGTSAHPGIATGNFESMTLPTKGSYKYHYGFYQIPMSYDCPTYEEWLASHKPGVAKREERLANGTVVKRTTYGTNGSSGGVEGGYYQCTTEQEGPGYFSAFAPGAELSNFVIPGDNRSKTIHYYSVWPGYNRLRVDSPDGFKRVEYGLPFTRNASKMRNGLYLSTETYLCTDAANAQCSPTPVRATYVLYEVDPYVNHLDVNTLDHNPRLKKMETVYFDDIDPDTNQPAIKTSTVSNDDFDGLGHYRVSETAGFGAATKRRTATNFNPTAGTFPGIHTLPSTASPWLLNLFTYQETKEIDPSGAVLSSAKTEVCFDSNNGFLKRRRTIAGGTIAPTKDLLAVFVSNGNGEVAAESYYGGDAVPLPLGFDTCNSSISGPQYRITHDYASGVRTRSQYDGTTFNSYDVDLYPSTSAISTSRDTAGVPTTYWYDTSGRVTEVHPQAAAWTEYEYNIPTTPSGIPSVAIRQRPEGAPKSAAAIMEQRHYFDGLGRLIQETSAMPNNQWTTVKRTYDFMGRVAREYVPYTSTSPDFDMSFTPSSYTEYTYDDLGRNRVIEFPDGKKNSTSYSGASQQRRTTTRGISTATGQPDADVATTDEFDSYGRLRKVTEKSGPTSATAPIGADVTTEYTYDLADRLTGVKMTGHGGVVQKRTFDYDGRGFLRWESHPESGLTSYTYDAGGHVRSKRQAAADSLFDLNYRYDNAERVVEVEGRNPQYQIGNGQPEFRVLKEFEFGSANAGSDLRLGKLIRATRYNYAGAWETVFKIDQKYDYSDPAGRVKKRNTIITRLNDLKVEKDIGMSVTWNELNMVESTDYPMCVDCGAPPDTPARKPQYIYERGRLIRIEGYVGSVSDPLTYWPNGLRRRMPHQNGIIDMQEVGSMARPTEISFQTYDRCVQPTFQSQPAGASGTTILSVSMSGTSPFTYSWRSSATNDVLGTTSSITVSPTTTTSYWVDVTNACGYTTSQQAKVTPSGCLDPETGTITPVRQPDGSWILRPRPTARQPRTYSWRRQPANTEVGTEETLAVGALATTTTYTLTIHDDCGSGTSSVTIIIPLSITKTDLVATWDPGRGVQVTWPAVTGATEYRVERRSGTTWEFLATSATPWHLDANVAASRTYAYRVSAKGNGSQSSYSNSDVATTKTYALVSAETTVTAEVFDRMLEALNGVRDAVGWPLVSWSTILSPNDPLPHPGNVIMARHVTACRARMSEALLAVGAAPGGYTDSDLDQRLIRAVYINEVVRKAQ